MPVETFAQGLIDNYGITRMQGDGRWNNSYESYKEDDFNNGWRVEVGNAGGGYVTVETALTKAGTSFD
jgi:hypothetical protein